MRLRSELLIFCLFAYSLSVAQESNVQQGITASRLAELKQSFSPETLCNAGSRADACRYFVKEAIGQCARGLVGSADNAQTEFRHVGIKQFVSPDVAKQIDSAARFSASATPSEPVSPAESETAYTECVLQAASVFQFDSKAAFEAFAASKEVPQSLLEESRNRYLERNDTSEPNSEGRGLHYDGPPLPSRGDASRSSDVAKGTASASWNRAVHEKR